MGISRFFGHLELMNIFLKALKKSGIRMKYSQGYNPKPKLSFLDTLPLGVASKNEYLIIEIPAEEYLNKELIIKKLSENLPSGLKIVDITKYEKGDKISDHTYSIDFKNCSIDKDLLDEYKNSPSVLVEKNGKNGKINSINLKEIINYIEFIDDNVLSIKVDISSGPVFRPELIIKTIFNLKDEILRKADITKH
jgi:radical SAM-linked protein